MLIDDVTIKAKAGKGGNGMIAFAKTLMNQGPTGGDGGKGGDIVVRGVSDLGALRPFKTKKLVVAENGEQGGQNTRTGAGGKDGIIIVPVGTVVHDLTHNKDYEINKSGEEVVILKGGNGGFGNFYFRSSTDTTPERANPGLPGEEAELRLELKMIADIGFVGFPNVGKSSLLNELTNASSKVANYKFTTLEPHLGVYYELILADIPGIIEGAAEGKGLGHKFLRHIERTKILFHFIAANSEDLVKDYEIIKEELGKFNKELLEKEEWIIISKTDESNPQDLKKNVDKLKKKNPKILTLSLLEDESLEELKKVLNEIKDRN